MTGAATSTITLPDGVAMPTLGLGTWRMDDRQAEKTIAEALQVGYRLIDSAAGYGNEAGVGRGVHVSGIDRAEVFVTTKITGASHGFKQAEKASRPASSASVWST